MAVNETETGSEIVSCHAMFDSYTTAPIYSFKVTHNDTFYRDTSSYTTPRHDTSYDTFYRDTSYDTFYRDTPYRNCRETVS